MASIRNGTIVSTGSTKTLVRAAPGGLLSADLKGTRVFNRLISAKRDTASRRSKRRTVVTPRARSTSGYGSKNTGNPLFDENVSTTTRTNNELSSSRTARQTVKARSRKAPRVASSAKAKGQIQHEHKHHYSSRISKRSRTSNHARQSSGPGGKRLPSKGMKSLTNKLVRSSNVRDNTVNSNTSSTIGRAPPQKSDRHTAVSTLDTDKKLILVSPNTSLKHGDGRKRRPVGGGATRSVGVKVDVPVKRLSVKEETPNKVDEKACDQFRLDMKAREFNTCNCGFVKANHTASASETASHTSTAAMSDTAVKQQPEQHGERSSRKSGHGCRKGRPDRATKASTVTVVEPLHVMEDTFDDSAVELKGSDAEELAVHGKSKQRSGRLGKALKKVKSSFHFIIWDGQEVDGHVQY